ncbi:MAG: DUF4136 domain-containing protein [bacterium]|nr:MAG: DUF4136 domain-containing protein [bacterium]
MKKILFLAIILIFALYGIQCAPAIKAGYDFDTEEDFTRFNTYSYLTHPENTQMSELVLRRVKQAIDRELTPKGLTMVSENPDIQIAIHTNVRSKVQLSTWGYSYSPYVVYWSSYGYFGTYGLEVREYQKGTLIVDFIDAQEKQMIWRGVAEGSLPDIPRSEQIEKIVNKAVKKMMKNYPPPPRKK